MQQPDHGIWRRQKESHTRYSATTTSVLPIVVRAIHPVQALMTKNTFCIILVFPTSRKYLHLGNANKFWCWEALEKLPHHVLSHRHLSTPHCQSHTPCAGSDGDEESIFCTVFVILPRKYLHLVDATRLRYVEAPERVPHHVLSHHHLSTPHC